MSSAAVVIGLLRVNILGEKFKNIFLCFSMRQFFCMEIICMKYQTLFSGENKKLIVFPKSATVQ